MKKSTIWVLMERSSIVEFNYLKIGVSRGQWRSVKGNYGGQNQNVKMSTIWILLERSSIVEFNSLTIFVIRGHKRSLEVNKGQMEVKNKNEKSQHYGYCWKGLQL